MTPARCRACGEPDAEVLLRFELTYHACRITYAISTWIPLHVACVPCQRPGESRESRLAVCENLMMREACVRLGVAGHLTGEKRGPAIGESGAHAALLN